MMTTGNDKDGFLKHFLAVQDMLKSYLYVATRDSNEADDLFQEVSAVLWEKFGEYDPSRPFKAWAMGIAHIQVLRWRRTSARSRLVLSAELLEAVSDTTVSLSGELDHRRSHIRACLERFGSSARRLFDLRYSESLRVSEIAARLKKTTRAVEMMLVRARQALRSCVDRKLAEDAAS
jgi:RNA polymerase sigma-70 factor (ECF subfamily)